MSGKRAGKRKSAREVTPSEEMSQTNGNDCGAYAIANMVSILHGIDPRSVSYNVSAMRRHLQQGLENKKTTVFPIKTLL